MIGIISAMQMENEEILKKCKHVREITIASRKFYEAELAGKKVVCVLSGVAKVNAAISTTLLLEHFPIDAILNIGTAGGLNEKQNVLDCVISTSVVQHDYDTSGLDGDEGKGIVFQADPKLLRLAQNVADEMKIVHHDGLIASGDQFISSDHQIHKILSDFPQSLCAEMEAGGIAQTASNYGIPFVVIRSLSDIALKEKSEMDFMEYARLASTRSAEFCERCVSKIR